MSRLGERMTERATDLAEQGQQVAAQHFAALEKQTERLSAILDELAAAPGVIAVTNAEQFSELERGFPTHKARRWTIKRTTSGGVITATVNAAEIIPANNRRLGGRIVNL